MSKVKETKYFEVNRNIAFRCQWIKTSYGFKHEATLLDKYNNDLDTAKCTYYNRTWESFEYESVLRKLLEKTTCLSKYQKRVVKKYLDSDARAKDDLKGFNAVLGIAKLGSLLTDNQKAKNDWQKRILQAGLGDKGLEFPADWDKLSEQEKETRLNKVIELNR